MRILIRLRCTQSSPYEMQYHYHLQGFIYNLLKRSKYKHVHDREGFKFFCYSNVFPAIDLKKDDLRTLIISSPDVKFIQYLYETLELLDRDIQIGNMKLRLDSLEKSDIRLPDRSFTLITGTPIVIRIPRHEYRLYGIEPKGQYEYIYWRSDHPVQLFIAHVEDNLIKKYAQYFGFINEQTRHTRHHDQSSFSIFHTFKLKKQISTRITMKGTDHVIIGTLWEFGCSNKVDRDIVHFALDCGIGERNSLGFGFMNLVK